MGYTEGMGVKGKKQITVFTFTDSSQSRSLSTEHRHNVYIRVYIQVVLHIEASSGMVRFAYNLQVHVVNYMCTTQNRPLNVRTEAVSTNTCKCTYVYMYTCTYMYVYCMHRVSTQIIYMYIYTQCFNTCHAQSQDCLDPTSPQRGHTQPSVYTACTCKQSWPVVEWETRPQPSYDSLYTVHKVEQTMTSPYVEF